MKIIIVMAPGSLHIILSQVPRMLVTSAIAVHRPIGLVVEYYA